jgi:hypothetical protein
MFYVDYMASKGKCKIERFGLIKIWLGMVIYNFTEQRTLSFEYQERLLIGFFR